tara:strand:+ start:5511 stop:6266 length:756 start_codon:yes stop_codon:yes gene_type:complete
MNFNKVKNNFNSKGFVVIKNLFNKSTIKNLLNDKERIVENLILKGKVKKKTAFHKTKDGKVNTIHNIQNFSKNSFAVKLSKSKKILSLTNKILNGETKMRNVEYFLKPKKTGMPAPFHQDNYYWNIEKAKAVNVWIACSKSSKKNGGLIYLEKSHKHGIINHKISYAPGSSQKIDDKKLKKLKFRRVCPSINPGDIIIHHANVIHGSLANKSSYDRVGCVMSFKIKKAKIIHKKFKKYKESVKKNINKIYN